MPSASVPVPQSTGVGYPAPAVPETAIVFSPEPEQEDPSSNGNGALKQAMGNTSVDSVAAATASLLRPQVTRVTSMHGEQEDASTLYARPQARRNKTRTLSEVRRHHKQEMIMFRFVIVLMLPCPHADWRFQRHRQAT